jgi:hypothetical protein
MVGGLALLTAGLLVAAGADACEPPRGFTPRARLAAGDLVLMFRTVPAAIELGQHFAVEAIVCPTPTTSGFRVDAHMPEHRHGMNYRPTVTVTSEGRYRAEGLLFHMPGRWQLLFDVERGGRTERLTTDLLLE